MTEKRLTGNSSEVILDEQEDDPERERRRERSKLVRSLVFGGVDGLSATLALVWSSVALGDAVSTDMMLTLGMANLVAKGCSMGMGDYFGALTETKITGASPEISIKSAVVMFLSFLFFGGLPLFSLAPVPTSPPSAAARRYLLCFTCGISLFLLGYVKAHVTASANATKSGLTMVLAGGLTAGTSFVVGHLIHWTLGVSDEMVGK
eukprot:TRINITY_DN36780_c0_g1_i1.p1 TRINITY_DN36780_c0_g1~~TRINITY_DN36780_c0_g1_i1.p1  ORF type:complete len:222 (+),score=29.07 TRINITY_DN36780_c0_g1_i1:49-666(+)